MQKWASSWASSIYLVTVSLVQWRAVIGIFHYRRLATFTKLVLNLTNDFDSLLEILFLCWHYFENTFIFLLTLVYLFLFQQCHNNIEPNPGPRNIFKNSILFCHLNLNSSSVHIFSKITPLKGYNSTYKLDCSIPDSLFNVEEYNIVWADHPDNIKKRGRVWNYYKEPHPIRVISLSYINESILLKMDCNDKKVIASVIYHSPSRK